MITENTNTEPRLELFEILEKLDDVCAKEFKYGDVIDTENTTDTPDDQS